MRDYSNMPTVDWEDSHSIGRTKAQIHHQEPVILNMPEKFQFEAGESTEGCERDEESGVIYDCAPEPLLRQLASANAMPGLEELVGICVESGSRVDMDPAHRRLIFHD